MQPRTLEHVYNHFAALFANSHPIRRPVDLAAAIQAAGLSVEEVTDEWLRSLDPAWVYGDSDVPFADEHRNREYRRILTR